MANGIGRKITLGIAKQAVFGVAEAAPTYTLPVLEWDGAEEVTYIENEAQTGSIYRMNDAKKVMQKASPTITFKVSEVELPLLLLAFGTMNTITVPGETVVYRHTITFTNSNQKQLYTLFVDDPDRQDLIFDSFRIGDLNLTFNKDGFITVEVTGLSRFPANGSVTNTLAEWLEFTAQNCAFKIANEGVSVASIKLLTATLNHSFNISDDEDNFYLGDADLGASFNKEAEFSHEVGLHFEDLTYKDKWAAGTRQALEAKIVDTSRVVTGSVTNVNPSITFSYPSAYLSEWSKDGGAGDLLKQNLTIVPLDRVAVSDTPVKIVIENGVASY